METQKRSKVEQQMLNALLIIKDVECDFPIWYFNEGINKIVQAAIDRAQKGETHGTQK